MYEIIVNDSSVNNTIIRKESYLYVDTVNGLAEKLYHLFKEGVDVKDIKINEKGIK